jgi:acyl-CoA-binding protein
VLSKGLYKQIEVGDCTQSQPWALQIKQRAKHDSWMKYKGMSRQQAMEA